MTLALDSNPTVIKLVLRDEAQNSVTKEFVVPTSVWDPASDLFTALATIRDNLVTAYDVITDALVYRALVTVGQTDDTAVIGGGDSEVENIASIVANLSTPPKQATVQIPAPEVGIFVAPTGKSKNIVDIADSALETFIDFYQTTGGSFTISDGETIDDTTPLDSGKRIHRKSNKG